MNKLDDELLRRAATRLVKLRIREVSSVDRGAGEGTQIVLMKRFDQAADSERDRTMTSIAKRVADDATQRLHNLVGAVLKTFPHLSRDDAIDRVINANPELVKMGVHGDLSDRNVAKIAPSFGGDLAEIEKKFGCSSASARLARIVDGLKRNSGGQIGHDEAVQRVHAANPELSALAAAEVRADHAAFMADYGVDKRDISDPLAQLNTLAKRYNAEHPMLSREQSFARVYEAPENRHLVIAERNKRLGLAEV